MLNCLFANAIRKAMKSSDKCLHTFSLVGVLSALVIPPSLSPRKRVGDKEAQPGDGCLGES